MFSHTHTHVHTHKHTQTHTHKHTHTHNLSLTHIHTCAVGKHKMWKSSGVILWGCAASTHTHARTHTHTRTHTHKHTYTNTHVLQLNAKCGKVLALISGDVLRLAWGEVEILKSQKFSKVRNSQKSTRYPT